MPPQKNVSFPNKVPFQKAFFPPQSVWIECVWVIYLLCVGQVCWWVLFCGMAFPPPATIIKLHRVAPWRKVLSARCSSTLAGSSLSTRSRGRSTLEKSTVWSRMTCCARYISNNTHTYKNTAAEACQRMKFRFEEACVFLNQTYLHY